MRCKRNKCNGPMYLKGYDRDKYHSCILCGNIVYVNKESQAQLERRVQCKNLDAAEL